MRSEDRARIEKIVQDRKVATETFLSKNSRVYRSFLDLERKAYADGSLKKMHKELIAVGISIVINCESCLEWHISEALKSGASEEQVLEAIEVGIEMGGGPATVSSRFALKVLDYYMRKKSEAVTLLSSISCTGIVVCVFGSAFSAGTL